MNFYDNLLNLVSIDSLSFSYILVEIGFFSFIFLFFILFLILSPISNASRFSWMFSLLISFVFLSFILFNTINLEVFDNGFYFSRLNQMIKLISFIVLIGLSLAGLSFSTTLFTFEYILLILFSQSAGLFILSTDNLPLLFILIEVQALIGYTLVVYRRKSQSATEAGMKYFLLGSVSSSLMVFGISLIYGSIGSFSLLDISSIFTESSQFNKVNYSNTFLSLFNVSTDFGIDIRFFGTLSLLLGFLFKLSAAPLHFWTPEIYENIEFLTLGYFSTIPKLSILALLTGQASFLLDSFREFLLISGILSLLIGAVSGLFQDSLKKILAYSTISNTGYLLIVFSIGLNKVYFSNILDLTSSAIWIQMCVYSLTVIALTGFFQSLSSGSEFDSLLSLTYLSIYIRLSFLILLVSLSGVPPTLGFFAKFLMLYAVGDNVFLTILIMVASILSLFYYMRIAGTIFFYTRDHEFFTQVENSFFKRNIFLNLYFFPVSFLSFGVIVFFWFIDLSDISSIFEFILR